MGIEAAAIAFADYRGEATGIPRQSRILLETRLASHLRCLEEDATDHDLSQLDRLDLVRDQARGIREVWEEAARLKISLTATTG